MTFFLGDTLNKIEEEVKTDKKSVNSTEGNENKSRMKRGGEAQSEIKSAFTRRTVRNLAT